MSAPFALAIMALLGLATWLDLRRRQIPNRLAGGVALLWLGALVVGAAPGPALGDLATASVVLLAGIALWRCGWLGGGDVKLIAALSLWAGTEHLAELLLAIALSGGLLAVAMLLAQRLARSPAMAALQVHAGRLLPATLPILAAPPPHAVGSLPYGVAVSLGGCWLVRRLLLG
jgi:prepilin peptidase CpaA